MSANPVPDRIPAHPTLDDGTARGLSQAWDDLTLALVDELHAIASAGIQQVADAAKHGLEQAQASASSPSMNGELTSRRHGHGNSWSPWLIGASVGVGITLLSRWR